MSEASPSEDDIMLPTVGCFVCCPLCTAAMFYSSQAFEIRSNKPPSDHLLLAILAYLLCCPLGTAALYYSSQTRSHNRRNERTLAVKTSHKVFSFAVSAIVLGCIIILLTMSVFLTVLLKR
ncbi:hypothetical protein CapIbe_015672 [Capra ibex]